MEIVAGILRKYSFEACWLVVTFLSETAVLRLLRWGSIWRSFFDAFLVNSSSLLLWYLIVKAGGSSTLLLVVYLPYTILVEYALLSLLRRHDSRETLWAALAANTTSYLGFVGLIISALWFSFPRVDI